jgi:hypothetical protein
MAAGKKSDKVGTINFLTSLQPPTGNALHMSAPSPPTRPQIFSVCVSVASEEMVHSTQTEEQTLSAGL